MPFVGDTHNLPAGSTFPNNTPSDAVAQHNAPLEDISAALTFLKQRPNHSGLMATTALSGVLQAAQFPALTGAITTVAGGLASSLGTFSKAQLNAAVSDGDVFYTADAAAIATSGSAADLIAGIIPAGRMPAHTGDVTSSAGSTALAIANQKPWKESMAGFQTLTAPYLGNAFLVTDPVAAWNKGWFRRVAAEPTHSHKIQIDGIWFELDPDQAIVSTQFGIPIDDTGATDRSAAFIDMLMFANGRPTFVRRGNYRLNSPIVIDHTDLVKYPNLTIPNFWWPGTQMMGEGRDNTAFTTYCNDSAAIKLWNGSGANYNLSAGAKLASFRIVNRDIGQPRDGIEINATKHFQIFDIQIDEPRDGLIVSAAYVGDSDTSDQGFIYNNLIKSATRYGITTRLTGDANVALVLAKFMNNHVNAAKTGIRLWGADQIELLYNIFVYCTEYNIYFQLATGHVMRNARVVGNEIGNNAFTDGATSAMVRIDDGYGHHFDNNRFVKNVGEKFLRGYWLAGTAAGGGLQKNIVLENDNWVISENAEAFTAYYADSDTADGVAEPVRPNIVVYAPSTDYFNRPQAYGLKQDVTTGNGAVVISVYQNEHFYIKINSAGPSTISTNTNARRAAGQVVTLSIENIHAAPATVALSATYFVGVAPGTAGVLAIGERNTATFLWCTVVLKWRQITPWIVV
jgi:hypothetical protein